MTHSILHVFRDDPLDGPANMARDEHLLHDAAIAPAALRIYGWSPPTISLGYFQHYEQISTLPAELQRLPVVRRTTGGGAILHDAEVTYCLVLDSSCSSFPLGPTALYRLVHECWREVLAQHGVSSALAPQDWPLPTPRGGPFFCFAAPGNTDLLIGNAKLLGSAQRRLTGRVLQHGSLMLDQRFDGHPGASLGAPSAEIVRSWTDAFVRRLAAALGLEARGACWSTDALADVSTRREKYAGDAWTRLR